MDYSEPENLKKRAEKGEAEAQFELAKFIFGCDEKKAIEWYRKAAEQGHTEAQYSVSQLLLSEIFFTNEEMEESDKWVRLAAEGGHMDAQCSMGWSYFAGPLLDGGDKEPTDGSDMAESIKWFRKSAEQGSISAQYVLGNIYYYGNGVPLDYGEAFKLFSKTSSEFCLGEMYYKGQGVEKDIFKAIMYYRDVNHGFCSKSLKRLKEIGWNDNLWKKAYGISKGSPEKAKTLYTKYVEDDQGSIPDFLIKQPK